MTVVVTSGEASGATAAMCFSSLVTSTSVVLHACWLRARHRRLAADHSHAIGATRPIARPRELAKLARLHLLRLDNYFINTHTLPTPGQHHLTALLALPRACR